MEGLKRILKAQLVNLVVKKFADITDKIIPFFDKYPLFLYGSYASIKGPHPPPHTCVGWGLGEGAKALEFSDFKRVANLMQNKAHLTEEGLAQIRSIKSGMNFSRNS